MIHRQEFRVENRGQATDVWIAATRTLMLMKAEKSVYLSAWVRVYGSLLYHDRCQLIDTSVASMPKEDGFSFFIFIFIRTATMSIKLNIDIQVNTIHTLSFIRLIR